jgi:hypothetical protein
MKDLIRVFLLLLIVAIVLYPVIIGFITWNFWYIFLYFVWWIPAYFLTAIIGIIEENL